jgi:hypothetical protein
MIRAFWGVASLGVLAVLVWLLALMVIEDLRRREHLASDLGSRVVGDP